MNSKFSPLLENYKTLVEALKFSGLVYTKIDKQLYPMPSYYVGSESIFLVLPRASGSSISYNQKSPFISALLGKFSSKKMTSSDSIFVTIRVISSPKNTYPLEDSKYLMKIHFFTLGHGFPYS